ncbi:hypothetical protein B0A55_09403, partial [Friedmanniomyces simplex]
MATSFLLSLPEELVAAIASEVAVDDLLHLAQTCKELHRVTQDRLLSNATSHEQYKLQHDRLPLTTPELLRLTLNGSDQAWHIRALEHWGLRPEWKKWRTYPFTHFNDDPNWPEQYEDHSGLDQSFFESQEYDLFEHVMRERLHLTHTETTEWLEKTHDGWDEPLKGMLMALAPRLDRVNFIAYDSWQATDYHNTHPLTFLCLAITRIAETPAALWPPGFLSLRKVSVCTTTTLRHGHDAYYANASEVAPLFRLPNIKILNLGLLGYMDAGEPDCQLAPRSSSVEELAFYCCELDAAQLCKLIRACKRLRRFMCDRNGLREVTELLAEEYADCLEEPITRLRTAETQYPDLVARFTKLRSLEDLTVEDLLVQNPTDTNGDDELRPLNSFLPTSIESIRINDSKRLHDSAAA